MPLTAAQEALSNEQILGHIVDMLMHERSQATRTAALSCLRVNRTWYYQVITRLWSDTRAFTVRGNRDPTLDPELSNILNRVRKEERQRHAGYIKKARIYGCRYLDQGSGAHSKDLCDLEFPNLRTIELYITDSHQQFPLGFFPEVRQVTLRSSQENGLFSIDVIMIGAIRSPRGKSVGVQLNDCGTRLAGGSTLDTVRLVSYLGA
ncbi:hypothetical protein KEM54_002392 [Ascosphaera aggregata]|nr:hypothetical protein KEM54_002392 [Ascosphaera aggregata]